MSERWQGDVKLPTGQQIRFMGAQGLVTIEVIDGGERLALGMNPVNARFIAQRILQAAAIASIKPPPEPEPAPQPLPPPPVEAAPRRRVPGTGRPRENYSKPEPDPPRPQSVARYPRRPRIDADAVRETADLHNCSFQDAIAILDRA
ncbi:MAG: hypothetical protein AAGD43_06755 [Pseudomonadota bacterium]